MITYFFIIPFILYCIYILRVYNPHDEQDEV